MSDESKDYASPRHVEARVSIDAIEWLEAHARWLRRECDPQADTEYGYTQEILAALTAPSAEPHQDTVRRTGVTVSEDVAGLLCNADSYLSLLWHRYINKASIPTDLRIEVEALLDDLRVSYRTEDGKVVGLSAALRDAKENGR